MNAASSTMHEGRDPELGPVVVLRTPADPHEVISFAREIGAQCALECEPGETPDLVIEFRYRDEALGHYNGPVVMSEGAVHDQLDGDRTRFAVLV